MADVKLSPKAYVLALIEVLRNEPQNANKATGKAYDGVHCVWTKNSVGQNLNGLIQAYFGKPAREVLDTLVKSGAIRVVPTKGGALVYPGTTPLPVKTKAPKEQKTWTGMAKVFDMAKRLDTRK